MGLRLVLALFALSAYDNTTILSTTNRLRALHGSPPLKWNIELQKAAQDWAYFMAETCILKHSRFPFGENLYGSGHLIVNWTKAIGTWYNEINAYKWTSTPYTSNRFNFERIGHATQLLWRSTSQIGCAVALNMTYRNSNKKLRPCAMYVCEFQIAGNYQSDSAYLDNVYLQSTPRSQADAKA
jgi:uncharacterized protein YkwD